MADPTSLWAVHMDQPVGPEALVGEFTPAPISVRGGQGAVSSRANKVTKFRTETETETPK
jgi:hypothetical protein